MSIDTWDRGFSMVSIGVYEVNLIKGDGDLRGDLET
mgnify:FL=1